MNTRAFFALIGASVVLSSVASAQEPTPGIQVAQWQQPYTTSAPPQGGSGYAPAQAQSSYGYAPAQSPSSAGPVSGARHHGPGHRSDLGLALPVPLTDENNSADLGVGLFGMFALDLGFVLPTFDIGWQWNPLNVPDSYGSDRSLTRIHFGLGVQFEIENDTLITPVLGAMMDFNFWHVTGDVGVACGGYYYWYCYGYNEYDFTLGFTFRAGVDIQVARRVPMFTLGLGVLPSVTLQGGPFKQAEWWISPYLTATFHRR